MQLQNIPPSEPSEYEKERNKEADKREEIKTRAEIVKAAGTFLIPIVLLIANHTIEQKELKRNAALDELAKAREARKIVLDLQSSREASEAQLKASMFAKLLEQYESRAVAIDPQQKLFFLELLVYNFGDSLNLSPIINDLLLDAVAARKAGTLPENVVGRLAKALREAGSKQVAMLRNASGGIVYDANLEVGKEKTFEVLHCAVGERSPRQHILHLTLNGFKQDETLQEVENLIPDSSDIQVASITLKYDDLTGENPFIQEFTVESTDLPLIDNTPLRDGYRASVIMKPKRDGEKPEFGLVVFSQELASTRDKPLAREYLNFLESSPETNPEERDELLSKNKSCLNHVGAEIIIKTIPQSSS